MDNKAYRRKYDLERYYKLRIQAFEQLGNTCAVCGIKEDLEIDHIDPALKLYNISKLWGIGKEKREEELAKCQLLCSECHKKKTTHEQRFVSGDDRWCVGCQEFKAKTMFHRNKSKWHGYQTECKECRKRHKRR